MVIVGLVWLFCHSTFSATHLQGQTRLNGPLDDPNDEFEKEFESFEFEELQADDPANAPIVLGQNAQGQTEYSVLENRSAGSAPNNQLQLSPPSKAVDPAADRTISGSTELNQWITGLVLKHMPHQYSKEKNWGKQAKRWAGVKLRRDHDDGKLETKRRYKMTNHGTWRKYAAKLADPEKKFAVELANFDSTEDHKTSFDVQFSADLILDARQSKWVKGVQLYSFSADATATVRLNVHCELGIDMDFSRFPPELVLNPNVTEAKIDVEKFQLNRVSKAGGELAQQVTRLARKELDEKVEEHEKKLVKKLTKEIEENRDKLRLSITDAVNLKWFKKAKDFIPEDVRKNINSSRGAGAGKDTKSR